jgi:hypothetical protein
VLAQRPLDAQQPPTHVRLINGDLITQYAPLVDAADGLHMPRIDGHLGMAGSAGRGTTTAVAAGDGDGGGAAGEG